MASAKEQSLLGKGSDFYDEALKYCQPCKIRGKHVSATTFCVNCREYLCGECTSHHKALSATKDHVHVKPDEAKKAPSKISEDKCTKTCSGHKHKRVKYYCVAHSYLGCSICFTIDHKPCREVEHIPTVAANIQRHAGFQKFDGGIKNLNAAYTASIADLQDNIKLLVADERQVHQTFQDVRKQMNDALNKLESQVSAEAKSVKDKEVKKLDALLKKLQKSKTRVDALVKDLDQLMAAGKKCDAFVMVRSDLSQLTRLHEELTRTTGGQTFKRFDFQPPTDLLQVGALGKLNIRTGGPVSSLSAAPPRVPLKTSASQPSAPVKTRSAPPPLPVKTRSAPPSAPVKTRAAQPKAAVSAAKVLTTKSDEYWWAMAARIQEGDRVRRGRDWCDGDKDGGPGALGTVEEVVDCVEIPDIYYGVERHCSVRWDNGRAGQYRMDGWSGYQLEITHSAIVSPHDAHLSS